MSYNIPSPYTLLSSKSASSSTTISFTSGISTNFLVYYVKLRNIVCSASGGPTIQLVFSTNGGSSYLNSGYSYAYKISASGGFNSGTNGTAVSQINVVDNINNSSSTGTNVNLYLYNLTDSSRQKNVFYNGVVFDDTDSSLVLDYGGGCNTGTTAVNAIQFSMSSGNFTSGSFDLYGVTE